MREIKFMAYIKTVKWLVPVESINFDIETVDVDLSGGNGDLAEYNFDEVELMQSTGVFDNKGNEIYEGHIVKFRSIWGEDSPWETKPLEYIGGKYGFRNCFRIKAFIGLHEVVGSSYICEIVGHKFEDAWNAKKKEVKLGKYRHFKNEVYDLIHIANHSETGENLAIYKKDGVDNCVWARPLKMFLEEIPKDKAGNITGQKHRFEFIEED